ncbi:MAG: hypothetical protein A4E35_01552 [Methanoregula sp. PtaU1.Bin051]|nr:MAG: hypothetical protein A4E35_01552 [Methanoregula sp. PtaU1.Bin051]
MTGENSTERKERHAHHAFIPAGALIGLGIGLITGYAGSGVLIGLGLGFLVSAFMHPRGEGAGTESVVAGMNWMMLFVGIFMILIGAGLVFSPFDIWVYAVPAFLILLGLWFVFRAYRGH